MFWALRRDRHSRQRFFEFYIKNYVDLKLKRSPNYFQKTRQSPRPFQVRMISKILTDGLIINIIILSEVYLEECLYSTSTFVVNYV